MTSLSCTRELIYLCCVMILKIMSMATVTVAQEGWFNASKMTSPREFQSWQEYHYSRNVYKYEEEQLKRRAEEVTEDPSKWDPIPVRHVNNTAHMVNDTYSIIVGLGVGLIAMFILMGTICFIWINCCQPTEKPKKQCRFENIQLQRI